MTQTLFTRDEVARMIAAGETLLLAGDEAVLAGLPKGAWIGGTIPYFMSAEVGGVVDAERIFVTRLPPSCGVHAQRLYGVADLPAFAQAGPQNGFTLVLIPAFSDVHALYADNVATWKDVFVRPIAGWIAGINVADAGQVTPKVVDGRSGVMTDAHAAVMHVALPEGWHANIDIINLFKQGDGDTILFAEKGFAAETAFINGEPRNLAAYIVENKIDTQLPLVADYCGAMVNVSLQSVDAAAGKVAFYAPVFPGVQYRFAAPVEDYTSQFAAAVARVHGAPIFSCNCILNFLYAGLEGKRTAGIVGPMTFGEIAYMLLNQTMVYLTIESD